MMKYYNNAIKLRFSIKFSICWGSRLINELSILKIRENMCPGFCLSNVSKFDFTSLPIRGYIFLKPPIPTNTSEGLR
jgi:hypothetical protein